jgi:hypothetical protein
VLVKCAQGFQAASLRFKFGRASAAEDSATLLNDATDRARMQRLEVAVNQPGVTLAHAKDFPALLKGASGDSPDGSVHTRRVAAAGQDSHTFHGSSKFKLLRVIFRTLWGDLPKAA